MPAIPIQKLDSQKPLSTSLSSREIREQWAQKIKDEALFSARTTQQSYVDYLKRVLHKVASRDVSPQDAEKSLQTILVNLGYTPAKGFGDSKVPSAQPGSITDLSSSHRIQLIIDTNIKKARSLGQMAVSSDPIFLATNPAWRLTRTGARKKPRGDWRKRWEAAGRSVGWKGAAKKEMVALKDSPIWQAIGQGVGGFDDAIGSPYPPFAFGSGLAWVNVGRREWEQICQREGIKLEDPKSPVSPGADKAVTDPDNTIQTQKDLPDYAKSEDFQARLREALGRVKSQRARHEIARTDRDIFPKQNYKKEEQNYKKDIESLVLAAAKKVWAYKSKLDVDYVAVGDFILKRCERSILGLKAKGYDLSEQFEKANKALQNLRAISIDLGKDYLSLAKIKSQHSRIEVSRGEYRVAKEAADKILKSAAKKYLAKSVFSQIKELEKLVRQTTIKSETKEETELREAREETARLLLTPKWTYYRPTANHPELNNNTKVAYARKRMELAFNEGDAENFEIAERQYIEEVDKVWKPQTELEKKTNDKVKKLFGVNHTVAYLPIQGTNPRYHDNQRYQVNCQRCVYAYELIRRGYDVTAKPSPMIVDENDIRYNNGWLRVVAGKDLQHWKNREDFEKLAKATLRPGENSARFIIKIVWKATPKDYTTNRVRGHVFSATFQNGVFTYEDPQYPDSIAVSYFSMTPSRGHRSARNGFIRVDDAEFTDLIAVCAENNNDAQKT